MTRPAQIFVFEARPGVNVDSDAGEGVWKRLGRDADSIGESGDIVELCGFLRARLSALDTGLPACARARGGKGKGILGLVAGAQWWPASLFGKTVGNCLI